MKTKTLTSLSLLALCLSMSVHANVVLQELNGNSVSMEDLRGKWVLINYWASWCESCREEVAELNTMYANKPNNITLFGVNYDGISLAEQRKLIQELGIHYPNLADPANSLKLGDITGVPITFVFNPKGRLIKTLYGKQTMKSLQRILKNYQSD